MKISSWTTRHKWRKEGDELDFKDMEVAYTTGKGNHLVSIIVPSDTIPVLDILCDTQIRLNAGVLADNTFIFPSTGHSKNHVVGWDTTNSVVAKSGVDTELINATNNRGRLSTLYAELDVPEKERALFYKHMGHTEDVNMGTYQRPLPKLAVSKVGTALRNSRAWRSCN